MAARKPERGRVPGVTVAPININDDPQFRPFVEKFEDWRMASPAKRLSGGRDVSVRFAYLQVRMLMQASGDELVGLSVVRSYD